MPEFDLWSALPTLVPAGWGLMVLVFAPLFREDRRWLWACSVVGMALSLLIPALMLPRLDAFGDFRETAGVAGLFMLRVDRLALWLDVLFALAGLATVLLLPHYLEKTKAHRPEVYPLSFLAVAGMTLMVGSENLVMIFLGLEILSIPLYVLVGTAREKAEAVEGSLKYFLLGAFSTCFLVYGLALVLAATGHFDLPGIAAALRANDGLAPYGSVALFTGLGLIIVAFAFKVGAAPFQFWVPDVYQAAPTPVAGFMAVGTKAAAFVVLLRVLHTGFAGAPETAQRWTTAVAALSALTMVVGNLLALAQRRLKRLLAYSSVAHAGYLALALIAPLPVAAPNLVFYLFAYGFMTIGAFAVVSLFQREGADADDLFQFAGLWKRRPWLAGSLAIFLLSMAGIPPLAGFDGKLVIFLAALQSGHAGLAALMAVAAVVGAAYYLRVVTTMFLRDPEDPLSSEIRVPLSARFVLGFAVLGTILLGIFPGLLLDPLSLVHRALAPLS